MMLLLTIAIVGAVGASVVGWPATDAVAEGCDSVAVTAELSAISPDGGVLPMSALKPEIDRQYLGGATDVFISGANQDTWRDADAMTRYMSRCRSMLSLGVWEGDTVCDTEPMCQQLGLLSSRRRLDDGYVYFIVNPAAEKVYQPVPVNVDFVDALWMDPQSGEIYPAAVYNDYIEMEFMPGQSLLLRLYGNAVDHRGLPVHVPTIEPLEVDLSDNKWQLHFEDADIDMRKTFKFKHLQPWSTLSDSRAAGVVGVGVYTTIVEMSDDDLTHDWLVELGDVRESARVYINGKEVGTAWAAPFVISCGDALQRGKNTLRIEVANRKHSSVSGLNGPVRLIRR